MDLFSSRFQKWPPWVAPTGPQGYEFTGATHNTLKREAGKHPKLCNRWHWMTRNAPVSHPSAYRMCKAGTHQVSESNWSCRIFRGQSLQLSNNDKDQPKNIVTPVTPVTQLQFIDCVRSCGRFPGIHTTRWLLQQITGARGVTLSSKPLTPKI